MQELLGKVAETVEWPFDKQNKRASFGRLRKQLVAHRPKLLVMEGTGMAGGLICLWGRWFYGVPYIFSSGDAVGPFMRAHHPVVGLAFEIYERLLCGGCAGFIGWTPYLCGRALTLGAPRAMTASGWSLGPVPEAATRTAARREWRQRWGIPANHLVVGIIGSLEWNAHRQFCYGWDLVQAARKVRREDLSFLIIGGGSGLERLRTEAGGLLNQRVFLPGPIALAEVSSALAAMDVASLPQSLDGVGMFRYTTKISEYAEARCPVITNCIPMAYDLGGEWMWRLPGNPWSARHVAALTELLDGLTPEEILRRQQAIPKLEDFDRISQINRVAAFIADLMQALEISENIRP